MKSNECLTSCPKCRDKATRYKEVTEDPEGLVVITTIECDWCGYYEVVK